MREMSATRFFEAFGGGTSKNVVHWHFRQLVAHGWLRKVRTEKRKGGRGRPHDVYRATELAVLGPEDWKELPLAIRSTFSQRTLEQLREQVDAAFAGETFDSRPDRHLSWIPVGLEPERLAEKFRAMTSCFEAVLEEHADAQVRLGCSNEEPILMTVALAGFESPRLDNEGSGMPWPVQDLAESHRAHCPEIPSLMRLAKVFVDPLNLKIVAALNFDTMSPSQLAARFEGPSIASIDRRCKLLTELGWIFKVGEKTGGGRRGATENFYRATRPAVFDAEHWEGLSPVARRSASGTTVQQFWEKVAEALSAETFDASIDRHLSWCPLLVDQEGWSRVIGLLEEFFAALMATSQEGCAVCPDPGTAVGTFFLAGFESPRAPSLDQLAVF
ncbi:MAG TPA: hypothetical protein VFN85_12545 [Solirubrobacterales bacterium]|nr:hypothetical protein [Solirubrobacterales bacterium]